MKCATLFTYLLTLKGIYHGTTLLLSTLKKTLPTVNQKSWIYCCINTPGTLAQKQVAVALFAICHRLNLVSVIPLIGMRSSRMKLKQQRFFTMWFKKDKRIRIRFLRADQAKKDKNSLFESGSSKKERIKKERIRIRIRFLRADQAKNQGWQGCVTSGDG